MDSNWKSHTLVKCAKCEKLMGYHKQTAKAVCNTCDKMKIEVNNQTLSDLKVVSFNKFFSNKYLISYHFFNAKGLEVAYFNVDMVSLCGLQVLEQPRQWSQAILNDHTEKQDIKYYAEGFTNVLRS